MLVEILMFCLRHTKAIVKPAGWQIVMQPSANLCAKYFIFFRVHQFHILVLFYDLRLSPLLNDVTDVALKQTPIDDVLSPERTRAGLVCGYLTGI